MSSKVESVYIHIPFCKSICSYCDFCKMFYHKETVVKYLNGLKNEIQLSYNNESLKTLYIGGGTPSSLDMDELNILSSIIKKFKLKKNYEFTFECNIENIDEFKLKLLKQMGVNRISVGIESINEQNLEFLERHHTKDEVINKISLMRTLGFNNINVDLIYALPNETIDMLKEDLDFLTSLNINHISTYSLIIEPNTKLYIKKTKPIDEDLDYEMYEYIIKYLKQRHFIHYEISNFAKRNYKSKHNLTYWNNDYYYGFGLGASGYIDNLRYDNTRSIREYIKGNYHLEEDILNTKTTIQNELILGFRKIKGINKNKFFNKYYLKLEEMNIIKELLKERKLIENKNNIYINPKYIYISNNILINFIGD